MGNNASISSGKPIKNNIELFWDKVEGLEWLRGREAHCSCCVGSKIYIFGGLTIKEDGQLEELTEFLVFDSTSKKCERVYASGDVPTGRCGSTMASVDGVVYLFGGLNHSQGWMNDLYRFEISSSTWTKVIGGGCVPSARDKTSSAVIGKKVYIFGGFGPYNEKQACKVMDEDKNEKDKDEEVDKEEEDNVKFGWFNDLFIYDTVSNKWSQQTASNKGPSRRAAASMVHVLLQENDENKEDEDNNDGENSKDKNNNEGHNDDRCLTNCDSSLNKNLADGENALKTREWCSGRQLVVFGGRDKKGRVNDVHVYDVDGNKWMSDLKIDGKYPDCRSFHSSVVIGNRVVVCGGRAANNDHYSDTHVLDLKTMQWLQPNVSNSFPGRGVMVMGVVEGLVVMFGGSSNFDPVSQQCSKLFNDFYVLKADEVTKGKVIYDEEIPAEQ